MSRESGRTMRRSHTSRYDSMKRSTWPKTSWQWSLPPSYRMVERFGLWREEHERPRGCGCLGHHCGANRVAHLAVVTRGWGCLRARLSMRSQDTSARRGRYPGQDMWLTSSTVPMASRQQCGRQASGFSARRGPCDPGRGERHRGALWSSGVVPR